jgi:predicted nucleic acid-binding protein
MIAFLRDEPGAASVMEHIQRFPQGVSAHSLNLCEVYYEFWRSSGEQTAQRAIDDLLILGIAERNDMGPNFWRAMGRLKAMHRRVSLADCAAVVLSNGLGATLVTADRHELEPLSALSICEFVFIR